MARPHYPIATDCTTERGQMTNLRRTRDQLYTAAKGVLDLATHASKAGVDYEVLTPVESQEMITISKELDDIERHLAGIGEKVADIIKRIEAV